MTKDYDEYKAGKGKHKSFNVFLKVFGVIVIVGCIFVGLMFLLMVAFPKGYWLVLFK